MILFITQGLGTSPATMRGGDREVSVSLTELTPDMANHRGPPPKDGVPGQGFGQEGRASPHSTAGARRKAWSGAPVPFLHHAWAHTSGAGTAQRRSTRVCAHVTVTCQVDQLAKHVKARACFGSGRVVPECWVRAQKAWRHSTVLGSSESLCIEDASDPFNTQAFTGTSLPPAGEKTEKSCPWTSSYVEGISRAHDPLALAAGDCPGQHLSSLSVNTRYENQ